MTGKREEYQKQRRELLKRHGIDALICARCGLQKESNHLHHIDELCNDGSNDPYNLIPLCSSCHNEWDYYKCAGVGFKTFLNTPSLLAIAVAVKEKIDSDYMRILTELQTVERAGNMLKTGIDDREITYGDEYERQNRIFSRFPYSALATMRQL